MNTPLSSLAIAGGTPVRRGPLGPWPHFDAEQVDAVADVLRSGKVNYWTGDECRAFERESAAYFGAPHAIALTNGTVSLELLLHAWDIGPGDEVITTPRTFVGTSTAIVARGAKPVFVDVDRDSQLITAETIASAITPRTRAILPVHLAGWVAEMDDIMALARKHDLVVFEDCAQCHGARYRGRHAGTIGDAGSWSFCQDKIMTTGGEGGLVTMHDETRWRKAWAYKDHGKSWAAVYEKPHPPGFRWLVESFGTNWRMTEMQGALGRIQLRRLDDWVATRTAHAERLIEHLRDTPGIRIPLPPSHIQHAWYKFYLFVEPAQLAPGWTRDRIQEAIHAEGVPCMAGSCSEIYLEQAFPAELRPAERLPVARELGETSLMLLVHPTLTLQDMDAFAESVNKVLNVATTTPWTV